MNSIKHCPKCNGKMETGHTAEFDGGYATQDQWIPSPPQKTWFGGLKIDKNKTIPITTFRCKTCGYLESYAIK